MSKIIIKSFTLKKSFLSITIVLIIILCALILKINNVRVFEALNRKLPIYSVETSEKKVALTFDASWGDDKTEEILKILDKYNIKATFFLVGAWVDNHPDLLKEMYSKGHDIGNHTNMHPNMNKISKQKLSEEIQITDGKIMQVTGQLPILFRCPSGDYNNLVLETVESSQHYCIQWDVDSIDWKGDGADIEYNRVIKKVVPGSIVLFHNEARNTPYNLPRIIEYLKKESYEFVKVSDLIYKDNYYIDSTGKQISKKNH